MSARLPAFMSRNYNPLWGPSQTCERSNHVARNIARTRSLVSTACIVAGLAAQQPAGACRLRHGMIRLEPRPRPSSSPNTVRLEAGR
jgi:hypothetical protein